MEQSLAHRRRLCEQYNELLDHGVRRPIDFEAGAIAVYGEQGGTGHLVITRFRPDDRLEIVDMVEAAQVARAVERLQPARRVAFARISLRGIAIQWRFL